MVKNMFPWLRGLSLAWKLVVLLGLILLAMLAVNLLFGGNAEKVKADLGANQTDAALESGSDAVDTVGRAGDREADIDRTTASNAESIYSADGATEAVTPAVRDAGLAALCRRAAYKDDPRCAK